jgi:tyrosine-specific transport protein
LKNPIKFLGGILLIVGTSLGGGMLALPVGMASSGFFYTIISLIICWVVMTVCAFYILEVNLYLPQGANMLSMAERTLGRPGKIVTGITYLFLLYSLLCAYVDGGSDVFESLLRLIDWQLPPLISTSLYIIIFASIVYTGMRNVDKVNSLLMYIKLIVFLALIYLIFPHININHYTGGDLHKLKGASMLIITSFGFAIIVPSLREYFNDDIKQLKKVILCGSFFPLICYLSWVTAIMGTIPANGNHGLIQLLSSTHQTSGLAEVIEDAIHNQTITNLFRFFSSISMLTAFLGVSLCLFDFLADSLHLKRKGLPGLGLLILVNLPPYLITLYSPGLYISAFEYAGLICVILLILLPALMAYRGRYQLQLSSNFKTPGNRPLMVFVIFFGLLLATAFIAK